MAGSSLTPLWIVAGFLFLWNFSPSLGTPLLYCKLMYWIFKVFIGALGAINNAAGIVGRCSTAFCRSQPAQALRLQWRLASWLPSASVLLARPPLWLLFSLRLLSQLPTSRY